jgi:hypothetical protein
MRVEAFEPFRGISPWMIKVHGRLVRNRRTIAGKKWRKWNGLERYLLAGRMQRCGLLVRQFNLIVPGIEKNT